MKKVTETEIAEALGVSRVSVWKVLSGKNNTSTDLKRRVVSKALELGYPVSPDLILEATTPITPQIKKPLSIAVAVAHPKSAAFWADILHEIANEASNSNVLLLYTYMPATLSPDYHLPTHLSSVDGFVVMNVYNEDILRLLSSINTPKIFMDTTHSLPFRDLNGDLLLIEGRSGVEEITEHLIDNGLRKIGFIGDINYAQTNYERYLGFTHAMKNHNLEINPNYCLTHSVSYSYPIEVKRFLDSCPEMPEAFLCVSDFVADLLYRELTARGYRIPEDIAIAGFDGSTEFASSSKLTTVNINTHDLGTMLTNQLFYRIKNPNCSRTITYVCPTVHFGESTNIQK